MSDTGTALPRGLRRARRAAARFTTPLLPDDYLLLLNPLWSARELRGRVVKIVRETSDAATLVIRPGLGWSFGHRAGQYVGIGVQVEGRFHWRSYSLTSEPRRDRRHISVTVKAMPEGFLSKHLVDGVGPGTIVRLALPRGEFVLPDPPPSRLLFLTAGSGITPIMAMLRTLDRRGTVPDTVVVHSAPRSGDVIFAAELERLAQRHPSLRLHRHLTGERGRLTPDDLARYCPDWSERSTWACGPSAMLDEAEELWSSAGCDDRLHVERFSAALRGGEAEGGTVTFARRGSAVAGTSTPDDGDVAATVEIDGATTLLEAGESADLDLPYGCRMGICHTCVVGLRSGTVRDLRDGSEHRADPDTPAEKVQTCVTAAAGDCVLEI
ncbi:MULTISPECIES: ferredoxin reductase [unclassified Pseudonocardia]|uniref:ferredoxin reductase n=1 Tax=unclassified Pseudonocardia TaxID=2619320 RepID=UPI0001FFEA9A|nr:ferredoxin reductase [Pseudonocardia sp. Ae707_Ps1]OLM17508.1 Flavodoxin reductase (ferredoxin-NADPH reductase) family 1 [Pseudonocardia sp. Ae707_Ps1]